MGVSSFDVAGDTMASLSMKNSFHPLWWQATCKTHLATKIKGYDQENEDWTNINDGFHKRTWGFIQHQLRKKYVFLLKKRAKTIHRGQVFYQLVWPWHIPLNWGHRWRNSRLGHGLKDGVSSVSESFFFFFGACFPIIDIEVSSTMQQWFVLICCRDLVAFRNVLI